MRLSRYDSLCNGLEPSLDIVLSHFSNVLLSFLRSACSPSFSLLILTSWHVQCRAVYGNQFHRYEPEKGVVSFFEDIHENKLGRLLDDAKLALRVLETGDGESVEARDKAIGLGCIDAKKCEFIIIICFILLFEVILMTCTCELVDFSDSEVITFLKQLIEQLAILQEYLVKQFEPTYALSSATCDAMAPFILLYNLLCRKNELAALAAYGHITFDFLTYHYRVGETLTTSGSGGKVCTLS